MYSKLLIQGNIEVLTGMHIGGSDAFAAIGAVDSPVIKDGRTQEPILPGSSLKGKMRTLLVRSLVQDAVLPEPDQDPLIIKRLFGANGGAKDAQIVRGRLLFSDCYLTNAAELKSTGSTEVKFENTINRLTGVAMPRQIERVVRSAQFKLSLVYDVCVLDELEEDFQHIVLALNLLQMDYLGGHGTRGYGRVKFKDLDVKQTDDKLEDGMITTIQEILKGVN